MGESHQLNQSHTFYESVQVSMTLVKHRSYKLDGTSLHITMPHATLTWVVVLYSDSCPLLC